MLFTLPACSSDEAAGNGAGTVEDGGPSGAGGSASLPCPNGAPVCLTSPENGFVIESVGTTIAPGEDVQYCEVVALPGAPTDTFFISRIDGAMAPLSHHLNVMAVAPGSAADLATTVGQRVECANNGRLPFGGGLRQIFGSVSPTNSLVMPKGVGHRLEGATKLVFNYHYFNTTDTPVPARAALAFHLTDAASVRRELRRFGMYNLGIVIPEGAQASFTAECMMQQDVEVLSLLRHTHRWGKDFRVARAGGTRDGEAVFTSTDWEEDINFIPPEPLRIQAGEGLRFECAFDNTSGKELTFGELATDEMCILYGTVVPVLEGTATLPEDCAILGSTPGEVARGFPCAQCPDCD
jgi:hypothetical protein